VRLITKGFPAGREACVAAGRPGNPYQCRPLLSPRQTSLSFFSPASQNEGLSFIISKSQQLGSSSFYRLPSCPVWSPEYPYSILLTSFLGKTCLWWHLPYGVGDRLAGLWRMGDSARRAAGAAQVSKPKPLSIRTKWLQTVCFPGLRASRKKGGHYGEFVARFSSSRPFVSAARPNLYTSSRKTLGHISSTGSSSSQPCSLLPSHPLILSLPPPAPRRGGLGFLARRRQPGSDSCFHGGEAVRDLGLVSTVL